MYKIIRKSLTFVALISMLINSLAPFTYSLPQTFAQEVTPSPTDTPTPTETPAVTQTPTPTETPSVTPQATPSPTEVIPTPTQEVTPTPIPTQTTTGENNSNSNSSNSNTSENQNSPVQTPSVTPSVTPVESPSVSAAGKTGKEDLSISVIKNTSVQSLNLQASNVQASATLTTDKADYSPTDTAVITGTNLMPKATYMLFVSSTDPPAVNFSTQVTTNDQGSFTYGYQLDGNYRPNYSVQLKDATGAVVASTTFTDDASLGKDFKQCANDDPTLGSCHWIGSALQSSNSAYSEGMSVPQRLLLTNIHSTSGNVHTLTFSHQATKGGVHAYDFLTAYNQGNSPALTLNACNDFGGSDGTTCNSLRSGSNTKMVDAPDDAFISKDGSTQTRINNYESTYGNRQIKIYGNSSISLGSFSSISHDVVNSGDTSDSYVLYTLTWTSSSTNILLEMAGHLSTSADWGTNLGAGSVSGGPYHFKLDKLDGSSLGSQDNQIQAGALILPTTLTVNKICNPTSDTGKFNLQIDGQNAGSGADALCGGSTGAVVVSAASHTVGELAGTGTTLSNYTSVIGGDCAPDGSVTLTAGQAKVCNITNTKKTTVVVQKNTVGGDGTFNFTGTGANGLPGSFGITTSSNTGSQTYTVSPGVQYSVSETVPSGWDLTSSSCTSGTPSSFTPTVGQTITCTFTNTKKGHLLVQKTTVPGGDQTVFTINASGSGTITGGGAGTVTDANDKDYEVTPGTYSVSETVPSGWSKTGDTCQGVVIGAGETKTCLLTNTKLGSLVIVKSTTGGDSTFTFTTTGSGISNFFIPTNFGVGVKTFSDINPGAYSVSETVPSGWDQTSAVCNNGDNPSSITVAAGQTVTCTFTNAKKPKLTIIKVTDPISDTGKFNLSINGTQYATDISNGGTTGAQYANIGANTFAEAEGTGTSLSDYTGSVSGIGCSGTATAGTITLAAGDNKICTITNSRNTGTIELKKAWGGHVVGDNTTLKIGTTVGGNEVNEKNVSSDDSTGAFNVNTGTYYLSETDLPNYSSVLSCKDGEQTVTPGTGNSVSVQKDHTVVCTFINTHKTGRITFQKVVDDNSDVSGWKFTVNGQDFHSGDTVVFNTGTYTVAESGSLDYTPFSVSGACSSLNGKNATLTVTEAGGTCTFTNHVKRGNVVVTKYQDNNADGAKQDSEPVLDGWEIKLGTESSQFTGNGDPAIPGQVTFSDVLPTTYILGETMKDETWIQSNITCDNGRYDDKVKTYSLTVSPGSTVNCSIGNYQLGHIKVVKNVVKPDGSAVTDTSTQFPFSVDYSDPFNLTDGGQSTVDVNPGPTHVITETPSENYDFTGCESSSGGSALDLPQHGITVPVSSGQTVTVTCTNKQKLAKITVSKLVEDASGQATSDTTNFTVQLNNADPKTIAEPSTNAVYTPNPGGSYTITETGVDASKYEALGCKISNETSATEFSLSSNQQINVTCTNKQKPGTISGTKFDELGNVLAGWTIKLFSCSGAGIECVSQVSQDVTGSDGGYSFGSLLTGFYQVAEVMQAGWTNVSALFHNVTINPGTVSTENDFTNKGNLSITACKYERSGGLNSESQTTPVDNWTFKIGELSQNTGSENNCTTFSDLKPGTYTVSELPIPEGWFVADGSEGIKSVILTNSNVTVNFFNYKKGGITGMKWNDVNGDGRRCTFTRDEEESQVCEKGLSGWTIFIDKNGNEKLDEGEQSTITGTDGGYSFTDLNPGRYQVCEVIKPGWEQTYPVNTTDSICHSVTVMSGTVVDGKDFGNHSLTPVLKISKSNNTGGATMAPGNEVLYTITVKVEDADAKDVKVVDLLPKGFVYKPGSWTALSDVPTRGDLRASGVTGEPTYASPGTWQLGNMVLGETVTLTLIATIDGGQHPGTYKDVAWAEGSNVIGDQVLAQALPTGYVDTNFVGTDVKVDKDSNTNASISVKTGDVLGAMTELPATGANNIWVIMSGIVFGAGVILTIFGVLLRKKYAKKLI